MNAENLVDWADQHPQVFATEAENRAAARKNPMVAGIRTKMGPDHFVADPQAELMDVSVFGPPVRGVVFTPGHRRPPEVAEAVTRLIHEGGGFDSPTSPEPEDMAEGFGLDYLHSDFPDRGPQPFKERGYSDNDLRDELINRGPRTASRREALASRERQYVDEELTVAVTNPVVKSVILHCKHPFGYAQKGKLPDGSWFQQAQVAWPVPAGYTAFRVARTVAQYAVGCFWCDDHDEDDCAVMLVTCYGSLRLFATCNDCIDRLGPGPDYFVYDEYDSQFGYMSERNR